ncbi:hypothetical protein Tco_0448583 [Tanacetum coccineum]
MLASTRSGLRRGETVKAKNVLMQFWLIIKDDEFVVEWTVVKKIREPRVSLLALISASCNTDDRYFVSNGSGYAVLISLKEYAVLDRRLDTPYPMEVDTPYSVIDQNSIKNMIVFEFSIYMVWKLVQYGVSKDWIRRIGDFLEEGPRLISSRILYSFHISNTAYWSFGYGVLSFIPLWSLVGEDDEVEEAADEEAGGSTEMYQNMSRGDWQEITNRVACRRFFKKNECESFTVSGDGVRNFPDGVTPPDLLYLMRRNPEVLMKFQEDDSLRTI